MTTQTSNKIRKAMDKLLGESTSSMPSITKLAKEAGVSRGSIYNNQLLLDEWNERLQSHKLKIQAATGEDELKALRKKNQKLSYENKQLRLEVKSAATVIAELSARLDAAQNGTVYKLKPLTPEKR